MADAKKDEKPKGFFAGTIFEGGLAGKDAKKHEIKSLADSAKHSRYGKLVFTDLAGWGISRALSLWITMIGLLLILSREIPHLPSFAGEWLAGTAPIWMPIAALQGFWAVWRWYIRSLYISGRDPVVLEIKIPRELKKSPRGFELALANFAYGSGEGNFIDRAWKGQVRPWFSLEFASFGGDVHLYLWVWRAYRPMAEAALYSQYPDIEITEAEDYAAKFQYDPKKYNILYNNFRLGKPDELPIRSYIEFELDKNPKDQDYAVEPLSVLFELLSSIKPHEQIWIQIAFRATGNQGSILDPEKGPKIWRDKIDKKILEIRADGRKTLDSGDTYLNYQQLVPIQKEQVEFMQRNYVKVPFDVAGRGLYIIDSAGGGPQGPTYATMRTAWKPIAQEHLNDFAAKDGSGDFNYPWSDFNNIRKKKGERQFLDAYRRRMFFYSPHETQFSVMTNESLATIFHFPSQSITAGGLERIPAKKAEPPPNLPK